MCTGSCPAVAGMVSLLNDARFRKGAHALGFLNPLIYQNPGAFVDIQDGYNIGCGQYGITGFECIEGWDPVTGLGYPVFSKLLKIVQNLR